MHTARYAWSMDSSRVFSVAGAETAHALGAAVAAIDRELAANIELAVALGSDASGRRVRERPSSRDMRSSAQAHVRPFDFELLDQVYARMPLVEGAMERRGPVNSIKPRTSVSRRDVGGRRPRGPAVAAGSGGCAPPSAWALLMARPADTREPAERALGLRLAYGMRRASVRPLMARTSQAVARSARTASHNAKVVVFRAAPARRDDGPIASGLTAFMLAMLAMGGVAAAAVWGYFSADLPAAHDLATVPLPLTTHIYDRSGEHLLYTLEDERRELITLGEVPSRCRPPRPTSRTSRSGPTLASTSAASSARPA